MKEERKYINISVPVSLLERIDAFAEHRGIPRTAAIMVLTSSSLDDFDASKNKNRDNGKATAM